VTEKAIQIRIDLKACVQSGQCAYFFPDIVRLRADGFPELIVAEFDASGRTRVEDLENVCPAMAIVVEG